ncbi:MAG: two-component sensor histidine kinase [Desulfobacterales bacterium]|jgi:signal transduction histidine kinase|nr:two-component sensor histidine kinase [Desulfobacterales bacterium]
MDPKVPEEKIKPFRLVKYFAFSGLVVIFLVTIILSVLNTHWVKSMQRKKSEDYARVMIENLNHQVFLQFIIPVVMMTGKIQLSNRKQFERMDNVVRSTMHSFKVETVNIYSMDNKISYSFDQIMIGRKNYGGTGYQQARMGKWNSKLVQRGNLLQILLGFPKEVRLITFAPLRQESKVGKISGRVLGVVEIVQDLSEDYKTIFNIQILVIITCTVLMGALFVVLVFVVKRGEGIIQKRAMERLRLKERLAHAERLSSMGEMAAGISHEIRNPLGIIRSSAELLKKKAAKVDPANTIPDIIVEEANRLNRIITDFINYAKPRSPNFAACRVEEVIDKNITFLEAQINEQGYVVKKNYQNSLPEIMADSTMLYQSFLNILINAMQAMPDGGRILIEVGAGDHLVTVHFDDEGQGIPHENLGKIWDPFFTTKEMGTGLGLGIVKNIVESHGGSIQIVNRPVRGARVTIELPLKQKVDDTEDVGATTADSN